MRRRAWPAVGVALSAAVLMACDEATEPPFLLEVSPSPAAETTPEPAATAEPTPTSVAETISPAECGGMDCFRAFAALIDGALAEADGSFFADRGVEDEMTCAGDEQLGPCVDQSPGTVLRGIPGAVAQSDAFALFTAAEYAAMLQDWFADARPELGDEYGSGGVALYALAHRPASAFSEEAYQAVVTGIFSSGPDALRQARILDFRFVGDSWRFSGELFATVLFTAQPYLSGDCSDCFDQWERWEGAP